jgi:hypothetical protein
MYQLLSYVKYCKFIILTFIAGLFWATELWTVGIMPDSEVLPPLPCPVSLTKVGMMKMGKGLNVRRT